MAKNLEVVELACAPPDCPVPVPVPDLRLRRQRQECEVRGVAQRRQASETAPQCEVPLGDVLAPPVVEPVIESATTQPPLAIGQAGSAPVGKAAPSLLQMFMSVLSIGADEMVDAGIEERIIGSGDRAHHLALVSGTPVPVPQPLRTRREPLVKRPNAKSRADCRRRCGKDGFCDPSSDLGCGGVHCGNPAIRETL